MTTTTQRLVDYYHWAIGNGDPKTEEWPLVATPWPTIALVAMYLFIVKVGPKVMENRKAYELREILVVYNFALVLLSGWMMYEFIAAVMDIPNFNLLCDAVPYVRDDARQNRLARVCYVYWMSKFVEYFDTFFFILRKKNNQVSFLHVYHHASMCVLWWMVCKWVPGGVSYFGATCNSFVHVIMYAYYGLSAIGPQMRPYLWWKRYITKLQLTQFAVVIVSGFFSLLDHGCKYPTWAKWVMVFYTFIMMGLFTNFYIKTYLQNRSNKESGKKKA
ncbi:very long chain fatty acid elongase 4 [Pocillopora verrucosa]|uniref:very long chain fatty acid elongase 4 n=1 Tax=Pocillopora verrucosa TaxID=203993 RepID=UPI0033413D93